MRSARVTECSFSVKKMSKTGFSFHYNLSIAYINILTIDVHITGFRASM